jgi:bifunctional DNA-binding transcriptional regulator/antitoxin component of YhaV-PrlF toxin-antitoxin module
MRPGFQPSVYDRKLSRGGEAVINQNRRVTLPRQVCIESGLRDGDRLRVRSAGDGRLVIERFEPPPEGRDFASR